MRSNRNGNPTQRTLARILVTAIVCAVGGFATMLTVDQLADWLSAIPTLGFWHALALFTLTKSMIHLLWTVQ